jgi:DNA-binding XRE family transcriptional regulator
MDENVLPTGDLAVKIARLTEEKGWNQEDLAKIAGLNRHTVRQILLHPESERRLRNATVARCAQALGLSVNDLRTLPLERLLPRMHKPSGLNGDDKLRHLYEQATLPELRAWMERNPDRSKLLTAEEADNLLAAQGPGGLLAAIGVEGFIRQLERRRELVQKVHDIIGTEYQDLLEKLIGLIHEKIQPVGRDRDRL